jgi:enoyl-CoA hydratase/carnithine racemase
VDAKTINTQVRLTRRSPAYWLVTIDNRPLNVMGPDTVRQFQVVIDELEADGDVRVVVFDSAVEGYFLNHSDFMARLEDLTSLPACPTKATHAVTLSSQVNCLAKHQTSRSWVAEAMRALRP